MGILTDMVSEDESVISRATESLGEIVVDVEEVVINVPAPWSATVSMPPLNIHERAKKGIVHGTQYERELSLSMHILNLFIQI